MAKERTINELERGLIEYLFARRDANTVTFEELHEHVRLKEDVLENILSCLEDEGLIECGSYLG